MAKLFLFKVTDSLQITNLGLVVMPGIPTAEYEDSGDAILLLKTPNGDQFEGNAKIYYSFPTPTPDKMMLTVLFPELTKADVPIGTDVWFISDRTSENRRVDWMSILIQRDFEKQDFIDYAFTCDVYDRDPRYKSRNTCIGQNRGLFRINKNTMDAELLLPMDGDTGEQRYTRALSKVIKEYEKNSTFPEKSQFACG